MASRLDRTLGMALRGLVAAVVVVAAIVLLASPGFSQDKGPKAKEEGAKPEQKVEKSKGPSPQEMAEMMRKCMDLGKPGPQHKALEPLVGVWELAIKSWMGGPDAPPSESKGTCETKWVLDGRYIEDKVKCEMDMPDEKGEMKKAPYVGQGLTGYDNFKNVYVSTWADNMSTQVMVSKGFMDPAGKVFALYAEVDDPMTGARDQMMKTVTRIIDKNKHVMEMYDVHTGDNVKLMEIVYTRK